MGICPCTCKKTDQQSEILTENHEKKQEKIKTVLEVIKEEDSLIANKSASNIPVFEDKPESPYVEPNFLPQVQSLFRGFLSRAAYQESFKNRFEGDENQPEFVQENLEIETQPPQIDFRVDISQLPSEFLNDLVKQQLSVCGKFEFGEPEGKDFRPLFCLPDGSLFQGEINEGGIPCGKGSIFYTDGSVYEGGWNSGKFHGYGRMITPDGDIFIGDFMDGQLSGKGKKQFHNGNSYEGELLNSVPHGFGEEIMSDGSRYKGFYKNGLKNGKGVYQWPEGSSYDGEFVEDKLEGNGKYVWPDKVYEGEWKDSIQHGKGVFIWNDGKKYTGDYFMGKKQGFGVFEWPDGKKFEGNWMDGKQEGEGVFSKAGKIKQQGLWKDGKFVGKVAE